LFTSEALQNYQLHNINTHTTTDTEQ